MVRMLEAALAALEPARDQVRSSVAALEEAWRAAEGQQEQVRYRVASPRAEAAAMRAAHAKLILSQKDHERIKNLVAQQSGTPAELEKRLAALPGAREKLRAAAERVQQARALLALPPDYQHPEQVPADLEPRRPTSAGPSPPGNRSGEARPGRRRPRPPARVAAPRPPRLDRPDDRVLV